VVQIEPGGGVTWKNEGSNPHIVFFGGGGAPTFCLNGRAYVGNTPTITCDSGEHLRRRSDCGGHSLSTKG